jgi:steroid 5-alpha reductase family enzyme
MITMTILMMTVVIYLFIQMLVVWAIGISIKNPAIVDVAWPVGLMISGLIYLYGQPINAKIILISLLLIVWAMRLTGYLYFTRIKKGLVDKRYLKLSQNWKIKKSLGFLLNFELQGLFIFIISGVFIFISSTSRVKFPWLDWIAIPLCLIGIIGETLSDMQLQKFKRTNKNKVCNNGLWNYSRHPNYFFDWLTWCGFACFSLQSDYGWIGLVSPLLLYLLMTKVTGPMTERGSIESRGDLYIQYQHTTSMFFPWFKQQ